MPPTPQSVTWYTGPIASNPLAARLKKAGITSSFYSYGIVGFSPSCGAGGSPGYFYSGALVGISPDRRLADNSFLYLAGRHQFLNPVRRDFLHPFAIKASPICSAAKIPATDLGLTLAEGHSGVQFLGTRE